MLIKHMLCDGNLIDAFKSTNKPSKVKTHNSNDSSSSDSAKDISVIKNDFLQQLDIFQRFVLLIHFNSTKN